ncbi:MAG: hypothetical protein ACD_72C00535G0003 [uncultured bacterium]|nr:MAG: hypothetical protein ACD_72C00535G0003 [uncultured bacterium]
MYKNIIPELVSFDTNLTNIRGFGISENFDFFTSVSQSHQFHYKITIDNQIGIPDNYDFRNGYYFKKDNF